MYYNYNQFKLNKLKKIKVNLNFISYNTSVIWKDLFCRENKFLNNKPINRFLSKI